MDEDFLNQREIVRRLQEFCAQGHSGTLMLVTPDNHLARLVVDAGRIVYVAMGVHSGLEAVPFVKGIRQARMRYSESRLGARGDGSLPPDVDVLGMLTGGRAAPPPKPAPANGVNVLGIVEAELVECVGPLGAVLTAEQARKLDSEPSGKALEDLVNSLAREIPDREKSQQFRERIYKRVRV